MAGVAYKQRVNGISKPDSDTVIASIFTDESRQQTPQQPKDYPQGAPNNFSEFEDTPF
jgi:hypothetical protein